jgi:hypothetical protein
MVGFDMDEYSITHIGMDIDFHHPESDQLRLSCDIEDEYGQRKEHARIFTESASEQTFNAEEMLTGYINSSGKPMAEHIPARPGGDTQLRRMAITFPIQFNENTFHMMTNKGIVDIKMLRLAVEVSV